MYHGVISRPMAVSDWCFLEVDEFRKQMEFLARNTRVVPLLDGARELTADCDASSVALTFDDGLQCVFDVAFPILQEFDLPAALFLATDFIGTKRRIWFCEVNRALATTPLKSLTWQGATYDLSSPSAREFANTRIQMELKKHPQPILLERLDDLIHQLRPVDAIQSGDDGAFDVIEEAALEEMLASGLISLGAHTGSHAILSLLNEKEASEEVRRSVSRTAELAGTDCRLFAYPNGRRADYSDHTISELRALGIEFAVTTTDGLNRMDQPSLELKRIGVGTDMDFDAFKTLLRPVAAD